MKTGRFARVAAFVLLALPLLWACAQPPMSVGHMKRSPWSLEEPRSLVANFMRFDYQVQPVGDVAGIKGWAWLDTDRLPKWATWIDSLVFSAYICEADGTVVAHDTRTFLPREAKPNEGIGFEFLLRPEQWGNRPLFVAFGYRLTLTEGRGAQGGPGGAGPFFVREDAITR
jgi:hypothetical protein